MTTNRQADDARASSTHASSTHASSSHLSSIHTPIRMDDEGRVVTLHIDGGIFPDTAVSSTCASLSHRYFFNLRTADGGGEKNAPALLLDLERRDGKALAKDEPGAFLNELLAQKTRLQLQAEFGRLRERIVDYAFAPLGKADA